MAMMFGNIASISFLLLLSSISTAQSSVFDVTTYGAKPNADITQALANAWKDACASPTPSKLYIPAGTYKLVQANLQGPCKAPIQFQLQGTLQAQTGTQSNKVGDGWVTIERIDKLTLFGGGVFDGQGTDTWGKNCAKQNYCGKQPINIRFNFITNSLVQGVTSLDSKQFHVNVLGCSNLTFDHFTITAPAESLNTDGIHIGRSVGINITNSNIRTGDDCISLGDGSKEIRITGVNCGPGHGISVGSLGKYPNEEPVQGVFVKNCTLTGTQNGVRIKTWPDSHQGAASDMHFEDIIMNNVGFPVLIDQEYCPWNQCKQSIPSRIQLSKVSFTKIRGTSSTAEAVKLVCSSGVPCQNVEISDINLKYTGPQGPAKSICKNVRPTIRGQQVPAACTATA